MSFSGVILIYISLAVLATALLALAVYNTYRRGIRKGIEREELHDSSAVWSIGDKQLSKN